MSLLQIFKSCICEETFVFPISQIEEDSEPPIEVFSVPLSVKGSLLYGTFDFRNPSVFAEFRNLLHRVNALNALLDDVGATQLIIHNDTSIILGASAAAKEVIKKEKSQFYKEHEVKCNESLPRHIRIKNINLQSNIGDLTIAQGSMYLLHIDIASISLNIIFKTGTLIQGVLKYAELINEILEKPIDRPPKKGFTFYSNPSFLPVSKPDSYIPHHQAQAAATTASPCQTVSPTHSHDGSIAPASAAASASSTAQKVKDAVDTSAAAAKKSAEAVHKDDVGIPPLSLKNISTANKASTAVHPILIMRRASTDKLPLKRPAIPSHKHSPRSLEKPQPLPSIKEGRESLIKTNL